MLTNSDTNLIVQTNLKNICKNNRTFYFIFVKASEVFFENTYLHMYF